MRGSKTEKTAFLSRTWYVGKDWQWKKVSGKREASSSDVRCRILCRYGYCKNPSCNCWHRPLCQNYKSEAGCVFGKRCCFRHVEAEENPNKESKRGGANGTVALFKETIQFGCVSQDPRPGKSILWEEGTLRSNHAVKLSKGTWHQRKFGKERVHREVISMIVSFMSVVLAPPCSRRGHKRKPWIKSDASAKQHGTWREISTSSKNADKTTFFSPVEAKAMRAPTSKLFEERKFAVDTGASMHMQSKKDLSSDELGTLRKSRTPVQTNEEAEVFVHDLGLFVTVQLRKDTSAVLSLGKTLRRTRTFTMSGHYRSTDHSWPNKGRVFACKTEKFCTFCYRRANHKFQHCFVFNIVSVRLVFFKFKHRAKWQASFRILERYLKTKIKKNHDNRDADERLRDLPEWLEQEDTDNPDDTAHIPAARLRFLNPVRRWYQTQGSTVFLLTSRRDRSCEVAKYVWEPKWQGPVADDATVKPHFEQKSSVIWWHPITKSLTRKVNQETTIQLRCRGARSCHAMDSILSVQNQNFSGNWKNLRKVLLNRHESQKSIYTDNS